jgi:hypothetical protein
VAQLSIACAILLGAVACVYAVERFWFGQRHARAGSIAVFAACSDAGAGAIVMLALFTVSIVVFLPVGCVCLVQRMISGRATMETMQPYIFWKQICSALELRPNR